MRVTVIRCECSNPKAHRKLEASIEGNPIFRSRGFFSIEEGKALLDVGRREGKITQTPEEMAATLKELEACGLPATDAEAEIKEMAAKKPSEGWPENQLRVAAETLVEAAGVERRQQMVEDAIRFGVFTAEEGEKILAFAAEIEAAKIKQE